MKVRLASCLRPSPRAFLLGSAVSMSLILVFIASAQQTKSSASSKARGSGMPGGEKPAEAVYKNIKSLKGRPATEVIPTMEFMASSLGVECEFCHDVKAFEKDTKDEKVTAREMIAMQEGINKANFKGKREVTCNTCHHGTMHPALVPAVPELDAALPVPGTHEHNGHPGPQVSSTSEYLDSYLQAAGGEAALAKLSSRAEQGTVNFGQGGDNKFVRYAKSSGELSTSVTLQQGTALTVSDTRSGWIVFPGHHSRQMSKSEVEATHVEADIEFPINLKQRYTQFRVGHPETINGRQANVLTATRDGEPPVRLYFDPGTKLLMRVVYYVETPLGRNPTQIDIRSYSDDGGVKLPSQWVVTQPDSRSIYVVQKSDVNSPIDDSKFAKPVVAENSAH